MEIINDRMFKLTKPSKESKDEIIQALKHCSKAKNFENFMLILEFRKFSNKLGVIQGKLYQNDKVVLRGKLTDDVSSRDNFNWEELKIGGSSFRGFYLDYKKQTLFSLVKQGFQNSLKQGRIPFLSK